MSFAVVSLKLRHVARHDCRGFVSWIFLLEEGCMTPYYGVIVGVGSIPMGFRVTELWRVNVLFQTETIHACSSIVPVAVRDFFGFSCCHAGVSGCWSMVHDV